MYISMYICMDSGYRSARFTISIYTYLYIYREIDSGCRFARCTIYLYIYIDRCR